MTNWDWLIPPASTDWGSPPPATGFDELLRPIVVFGVVFVVVVVLVRRVFTSKSRM